jgi:hypothetical protein
MRSFVIFLRRVLNFLLGKHNEHKSTRTVVYETIKSFGEKGCISDEVLSLNYDMKYPTVTARYAELLKLNMIELTGEYRPGQSGKAQRVMRVKESV